MTRRVLGSIAIATIGAIIALAIGSHLATLGPLT